ncbi:hypothetical protein [Streptomyces sp. G-G2]|uniref:hypothetical protein n=1 Tax=Streptomyces sp. G-G2 TaxID=3046201 RepID=UPI0024BB0626|nr:hypothetical protein [Streptomyces sp. G-G2]MDJ0382472.1 hypothetical protein [Streptomyces sp. G-G2]
MGDDGGGRRRSGTGTWLLGAPPVEPRPLAAALGLPEEDPGLRRLRQAGPQRYARIERLHRAAQRAFAHRTRVEVCRDLEHAVHGALREAREAREASEVHGAHAAPEADPGAGPSPDPGPDAGPDARPGPSPDPGPDAGPDARPGPGPDPGPGSDVSPGPDPATGSTYDPLRPASDAAARALMADAALAGGRGLNTGLAFGVLLSPVALVLALTVARVLPPLFGAAIGCPEQLALTHALACFSGGALGAVFSVIVRLRDAYQLTRPTAADVADDPAGTDGMPPDPAQLVRLMRQEGWYRVVVGWFLAVSLFVVINGGILSLFAPPAVPEGVCGTGPLSPADHQALIKAFFFWGGVGFLAGLNERWAYGLLRRDGAEGPRDAIR